MSTQHEKPIFLPIIARFCHFLGVIDVIYQTRETVFHRDVQTGKRVENTASRGMGMGRVRSGESLSPQKFPSCPNVYKTIEHKQFLHVVL